MTAVVHESSTFLDEGLNQNHIASSYDHMRQLRRRHPEWEGLSWVLLTEEYTDGTALIRIRVEDPHALDAKQVLGWVVLIAFFIFLVYLLQ